MRGDIQKQLHRPVRAVVTVELPEGLPLEECEQDLKELDATVWIRGYAYRILFARDIEE